MKLHIHIPTLYTMCLEVAGPLIVERERHPSISKSILRGIPHAVYLQCIMAYAHHRIAVPSRYSHLSSHVQLYHHLAKVRAQAGHASDMTTNDVGKMHGNDVLHYKIMLLNHVVLDDIEEMALSTIGFICQSSGQSDDVIACIHNIAHRIFSRELDVQQNYELCCAIMSEGLSSCPEASIRSMLLMYGGKIDQNDNVRLYLSIGNAQHDVVRQLLATAPNIMPSDTTGDIISHHLLTYAIKSGDVTMLRMILDHCKALYPNSSIQIAQTPRDDNVEMLDLLYIYNLLDMRLMWHHVHSIHIASWMTSHGALDVNHLYPYQHEDIVATIINTVDDNVLDLVTWLVNDVGISVVNILPTIASSYPDISILDVLIRHGANINAVDMYHNTVMHLAPLYARYWIERGFTELGAINVHGHSILDTAVMWFPRLDVDSLAWFIVASDYHIDEHNMLGAMTIVRRDLDYGILLAKVMKIRAGVHLT